MPPVKLPCAGAIAAVLASVCLGGCEPGDRPLDVDSLRRQIHVLASVSAEAGLVIEELQAGQLTPSFAAAHVQDLIADAADAQDEIARPVPQGLRQEQIAADALARELLQALRQIAAGRNTSLEQQGRTVADLKRELDALRPTR